MEAKKSSRYITPERLLILFNIDAIIKFISMMKESQRRLMQVF